MPEQSDQPRPHGDPLEHVIDNLDETGDESPEDGEPDSPDGRPGTTRIADIEN